jgi:hypothetical protein
VIENTAGNAQQRAPSGKRLKCLEKQQLYSAEAELVQSMVETAPVDL